MHEYKSNRAFRILTNISIIDNIGSGLYSIVFLIYAATLPFKTLAVSVASIAWVIPALANVLTGYFADHTTHKVRSMCWAYTLQAFLFILITLLIGRSSSMVVFFIIMAFDVLAKLLGDYGGGLTTPLIKHIVTAEHMNDATSISMALSSMVQIIASALGATMIVALNHQYDLFALLNAATFIVATGILLANRKLYTSTENDISAAVVASVDETNSESKSSFFSSLKLTMGEFTNNKFLFFMVTAGLVVNTLGNSFDPLSNVLFLHLHSLWFINYGYSIAILDIASSLGIIAGSLLANDMLKNTTMVTLLSASMGIMLLMVIDMLTLHNYWVLVGLIFAMCYLLGKVNPRFSALLMNTVPDDHIAATAGVLGTIMTIGAPLGQFVFLTLANVANVFISLSVFGFCALLAIAFIILRGAGRLTKNDPTTARYVAEHPQTAEE